MPSYVFLDRVVTLDDRPIPSSCYLCRREAGEPFGDERTSMLCEEHGEQERERIRQEYRTARNERARQRP